MFDQLEPHQIVLIFAALALVPLSVMAVTNLFSTLGRMGSLEEEIDRRSKRLADLRANA